VFSFAEEVSEEEAIPEFSREENLKKVFMEVAECQQQQSLATESANFSDPDYLSESDEEDRQSKRSIPMCQAIVKKSFDVTATGQTGLSPKKGQKQI
jgi:hypothetical protein